MKRFFQKRHCRRPLFYAAWLAGAVLWLAAWWACAPPLQQAKRFPAGVILCDSAGDVLRVSLNDAGDDCRPTYVAERGDWVVKALVSAEDARFWDHAGVDPLALARAVSQNIGSLRRISGASTLTTQAVRLITPRPRTFRSKFIEAVQALRLERSMSKEQILTQYLNRAPFGSNLVGVEAAAQGWFGKSAKSLSLGEAALLAGMVQSPSRFRPDKHLDAALRRREYVFARMMEDGVAGSEQVAAARAAPVVLRRSPRPFQCPFYCDWFLAEHSAAGGVLRTPLDARVQRLAEAAVAGAAGDAFGDDVAAVVASVATGDVIALACSGNYFSPDAGQVNTATAPRPAGSTLKPFLYAGALERGLIAPSETLADIPRFFGNYAPANSDGVFRGTVGAGTALVLSLNLPFIDLLLRYGVETFAGELRGLGLGTVNAPTAHYGLGLAVGNASVRLVDLARAYARFAGRNSAGAFLTAEALAGDERSGDALGHVADARLPRVAWKTGTSSDLRDAWTVAWNPEYVVAVWRGQKRGGRGAGNFAGITAAAPVAWTLLRGLYFGNAGNGAGTPWFTKPPAVETRRVCTVSGKPPSRHCGATRTARTIAGVTPVALCDWHRAGASDATGGSVLVYPPDIAAFFKTKNAAPSLRIVHPADGTVFKMMNFAGGATGSAGAEQAVAVRLTGAAAGECVWWFVNGILAGETTGGSPFVWHISAGAHRITAATATRTASVNVRAEP